MIVTSHKEDILLSTSLLKHTRQKLRVTGVSQLPV